MKKLVLIGLMLLLVGCSSEKGQLLTHVCSNESGHVEFTTIDNKIQTMKETDVYTFKELNITSAFLESEANRQALRDRYIGLYSSITKGIDITMTTEDDKVIFTIIIDFTEADFTELKAVGIISDDTVDYLDFEKTQKAMNITCE